MVEFKVVLLKVYLPESIGRDWQAEGCSIEWEASQLLKGRKEISGWTNVNLDLLEDS